MSHELRTPLNAILGFAQVLNRDADLKSRQKEKLRIIARSGEHLLSLINDVLEISKVEEGRVILSENKFDLHFMLKNLFEMFELKTRAKGIQLEFEQGQNLPQYVQADEQKLRQVLINLLSNAVKFTPQGEVTLKVTYGVGDTPEPSISGKHSQDVRRAEALQQIWTTENRLCFQVIDTGLGIAPEEIDQLFEAFTQTATGRQISQGTGLGLPISRRFVQLMGGDITVVSQLNQGSRFNFDIPIRLVAASSVATVHPQRRVLGLEPGHPVYRLLIVDDQWENRQIICQLLQPLGFEVRSAEGGKQAISLWQTWCPHLVWMDLRMPGMDGYETTRQIRSQPAGDETVIVALTASTFGTNRTKVMAAGCNDLVHKPFCEHELFEKLEIYLGVKFLYEDLSAPSQESKTGEVTTLTPESLEIMPEAWVTELYKAAELADEEEILMLVEQIPAEQASLAIALKDLVNNFQFERLLELADRNSPLVE